MSNKTTTTEKVVGVLPSPPGLVAVFDHSKEPCGGESLDLVVSLLVIEVTYTWPDGTTDTSPRLDAFTLTSHDEPIGECANFAGFRIATPAELADLAAGRIAASTEAAS